MWAQFRLAGVRAAENRWRGARTEPVRAQLARCRSQVGVRSRTGRRIQGAVARVIRLRQRLTAMASDRSRRRRTTRRRRGAQRALPQSAAAAVRTGTGQRRARPSRAAVRTPMATAGDRRRVRSWTCGSRSCGRPPTVVRALRLTMLRRIMLRVTVDRIARRPATAAAAATQVLRAADIPPGAVEDTRAEAGITRLRAGVG
jgi:hypothetical protein